MRLAMIMMVLGLLGACASTPQTPDQLYSEGVQDISVDSGFGRLFLDCVTAGQKLRRFVTQNPFDKRAPLAQARIAACFEQQENWTEAEAAWRTFIALYPGHKLVAKAMLGQAEANWELRESLDRDPTRLRNALAMYSRLIRDYPRSEEARSSVRRYNEIRNMLAEHSYNIGRWYERVRRPMAALTRYQETATLYTDTAFGTKAQEAAERLSALLLPADTRLQ